MTTTAKLEMTENQYEQMIFGFYARWCESVTGNSRQFQQALANSSINNWFLMELTKCEAEFHQLTDRYVNSNVTSFDFQKCYNECTYRMFNIRPAALLETIKIKQGVKVFNTINQN
ncbi:hypothetical protein [Flavobacterium sp. UMI-01]|uniref:hypothetical protein n=1 Tax=Flavobacterium sp. UMI-01 TaxID=1441053 RepID=UPI001C7CEA13|nr:hypothetical protein [Flavobacterium sp. UMI-01]GIZ10253.1 hypothetical protein FUMI01_29770 [Flavobacterium sp. UMI-01]